MTAPLNRVPQTAVYDTGADPKKAAGAFADDVNAMMLSLRKRVEVLEATVNARLGTSAPEITGSKLTGAAYENLLIGLDGIGLIKNSTTV